MKVHDRLSIGQVAARTGLTVETIRFYETKGLVQSARNSGGQRRFERASIRQLSFVMISQQLGFSLADIKQHLDKLPDSRTPTRADWEKLAREFRKDIDKRVSELMILRETLTGCIGCGCLSLQRCKLYNKDDIAGESGSGARYVTYSDKQAG